LAAGHNERMNWLEFFSTLIGDLVWPVVVVIALVIFRGTISSAIAKLLAKTSGKLAVAGIATAEWNGNSEEVEEAMPDVAGELDRASITLGPTDIHYEPVEFAPEAGSEQSRQYVLERLRELEDFLRQILLDRGVSEARVGQARLYRLTVIGKSEGLIDEALNQALRHIAKLGQFAESRAVPVTVERGEQFASYVQAALSQLEGMKGHAVNTG